jgi:alpha-D-ribose 1-methylphosphonate 5-triphosphate synthase subunit PhnG
MTIDRYIFLVEPPKVSREKRQEWLRLLSCADAAMLMELSTPLLQVHDGDVRELRRGEIGLALVTGRVGATGEPFGVGEMTMTRSVVQFGDHVGVGYVPGRAPDHARRTAVLDALLQSHHHHDVAEAVLAPLASHERQRRAADTALVESTRVQFLTMVRGN